MLNAARDLLAIKEKGNLAHLGVGQCCANQVCHSFAALTHSPTDPRIAKHRRDFMVSPECRAEVIFCFAERSSHYNMHHVPLGRRLCSGSASRCNLHHSLYLSLPPHIARSTDRPLAGTVQACQGPRAPRVAIAPSRPLRGRNRTGRPR